MYNIWKSDKDLHAIHLVEQRRKIEATRSTSNRERREELVHNYKKRVENFVMQMMEKPIRYNKFKGPQAHKFRDEDTLRFKGGSTILIKSFKSERDRIREAIEKNSKEYQNDPINFAAHEYRSRDAKKEIQPQMHFSTKSGLDRIINRIGAMPNNVDSEGKRLDQNDSFLQDLHKSPVIATNRYIARHFMPELHQKTHFKAATSLCLALPDTLVGKDLISMRKSTRRQRHPLSLDLAVAKLNSTGEESPETGLKSKKMQKIKGFGEAVAKELSGIGAENEDWQKAGGKKLNIDTVNPADVSRQVLLDCNFITSKLPSVRTLRMGDGHLSMLPDKSLRQIYHDILHKDLSSFRKA